MRRLAVCLLAAAFVAPAQAQERPVDLELALAIDVSGSIDPEEALLQGQGYISAFRHPDVIRAIEHGMLRRITGSSSTIRILAVLIAAGVGKSM